MPTGLSYNQLMKVPYIMGLISRIGAPGNDMTRYYGLGITPTVPTQQIIGRAGQYDIFDGTRSLSPMTAPGAPPVDINRKPIGTQPITVPRMYNKIGIEDEKIFGTRNLGQPYNQPVGSRGEEYLARQARYLKTRMNNSHEYMTAHMFRGGWKVKPYAAGSQLFVLTDLADATAGAITNDTLIPAGNKGNIGGIIGTSWSNPAAPIIEQFLELQKRAAQVNGRKITEVWLNGTTAKHLFTNTQLQAVGGTAYRIFDRWNPNKELTAEGQRFPDTGILVQFRGLPDVNFHIYNQGYVTPGTSESFEDQIGANWTPFIPDNYAIMTPPPGDWVHMIEGSEPAQWNLLQSGSQIVTGFGMGTERAIDPPRTDIKMLYNGAPAPVEPYAVYYATVVF